MYPSLGDVIDAHHQSSADVLLPFIARHADQPKAYEHWFSNQLYLQSVPKDLWSYALVSAGRYSLHFMGSMSREWERGEAWYEEIWLPTKCKTLNATKSNGHMLVRQKGVIGCRLETFAQFRGAVLTTRFDRGRVFLGPFRYRPLWDCYDVLELANSTLLWHPVKERECWLDYLDWRNCTHHGLSGCHEPHRPITSSPLFWIQSFAILLALCCIFRRRKRVRSHGVC